MGGRLLEGPTMAGRTLDWRAELGQFLKPFLDRLGHKARREMCPLYVSGLIGPGDRKSIAPMAKRLALGECDQLHPFIAAGVWDATPVETELLVQADRLVGGSDAVLVIDDTAIPKKGTHSVGVAPQYASALGKTSNCQTLYHLHNRLNRSFAEAERLSCGNCFRGMRCDSLSPSDSGGTDGQVQQSRGPAVENSAAMEDCTRASLASCRE